MNVGYNLHKKPWHPKEATCTHENSSSEQFSLHDNEKRIKIFWIECSVIKEQEGWACSGYVELPLSPLTVTIYIAELVNCILPASF